MKRVVGGLLCLQGLFLLSLVLYIAIFDRSFQMCLLRVLYVSLSIIIVLAGVLVSSLVIVSAYTGLKMLIYRKTGK